MNAMLESYRNSCNQLTIRISELSQQIQQTCSQTEADCLNSRKHLLQTERLELLRDMQDMQPYVRGMCMNHKRLHLPMELITDSHSQEQKANQWLDF